ncbi:MAG: DUF2798 domain-containing protein [Providencia heimbachae]|nr:DUF2798 domain-containing protein [Providencia heimbachae]
MDKRTIILTQIIMTCLMASSMSGIMLFISIGFIPDFFTVWSKQFIIAWPIAFIMTNLMWPIASKLAFLICSSKKSKKAEAV